MHRFFNNLKANLNSWSFLSIFFILFISTPIFLIIFNISGPMNEIMEHIINNLLKTYIKNTLIISLGTVLITIFLGVSLAYFISFYEFRGRKFFSLALILPLAIPDYIGAHVYANIFSYSGYIPTLLRERYGIMYNLDIMNNYGAIFVFAMCFYPYVYIVVKSFLSKQSNSIIEVSKSLGKSNKEIFFKVLLPLSRGAIVGGSTLVVLEVLNAYGLPNYFGIHTFSTGIFRAWFSFKDLSSAVKMAAMLLVCTYLVIIIEKLFRRGKNYSYSNTKIKYVKRVQVSKKNEWFLGFYCFSVLTVSFIIPILQLLYWAKFTYKSVLNRGFYALIGNSVLITLIATFLIIAISVIIANTARFTRGKSGMLLSKLATMGYAVPGAVIAIGMLMFFIAVDKMLVPIYQALGIENTLVLTLGFPLLISAYIVRFLSISFNTVENGFEKIGLKFHEASRSFGNGVTKTFFKVDLPMMRGSLIGAGILVFVEIIKELPLTLLLRPFNFETLATIIKKYAEDEMLPEASIPSLILVVVCIVLLMIFNRINKGGKE